MNTSKMIVILGANGGTGKYLVDYFLNHFDGSFELVGVGRHSCKFVEDRIPYIQLDISKKEDLDKLPRNIYAIVDLAGAMPARMQGYHPEEYINTNIVGTFNILEFCRKQGVDRILFTQSFGDIKDRAEKTLILKPDMIPLFDYATDHSLYVVSKNTAVEMLKCYHALHGLKTFIFRLPTIYSWSQNDSYYVDGELKKRAWRLLIDKATKGEPIEVWGDKTRLKDMVYVKDFCQMLFKACFADHDYGYYNVGTGVGTSLYDQITGMIEVFGDDENRSDIILRPDKPNAPQYIMDISNAKAELNYEPVYDYLTMLKDMKLERDANRF